MESIKTCTNVCHLSTLGLVAGRSHSPSHTIADTPLSQSTSSVTTNDSSSVIVSPLLALVKAYRLRGTFNNLKHVVAAHFDISLTINRRKSITFI